MWRGVGGPQGVMVVSVLNPELKQFEGKTVAEIAQIQNKDPLDAVMDFLIADHNNTGAVYFSMSEQDVRLALQQPWVSVGTDYGEVNTTGPLSESKSHPRAWGSFPKILGEYVREEHVLRLEDAIRKMTYMPARRVGLEKRGLVAPDYYADLTIFDPKTVRDVATFEDPNRPSVGIEYVFVNGVLSLEHEKLTGQLGGRPLRGPAYANRGIAPEGLRPKGKIQGMITTPDGWPLPRTTLTLLDSSGKTIAGASSQREGRYEIVLEQRCDDCQLKAERLGFAPEIKKGVRYNGANPLWFSLTLRQQH
jgi:dihydroorotase/N-acyl-D-amino-acid deacylase